LVRFFCDRNVRRLAKYLRFIGFDTMTREELSIVKIDTLCKRGKRVFITTRKGLRNFMSDSIVLDSTLVFEQLKTILSLYEVNKDLISTRCIKCNVRLKKVIIDDSKKYCPRCGRLFWEGSHYHDMMRKIEFFI
jgi:uncharacterized protein with PIN domain